MASKKINTKNQAKPGLRMNEMVKATGLPKSTLLYYVDQGLLPQPVKTSPNMAYYDPSCVQRAAMIKEMQAEYRFPLQKIKLFLEMIDDGQDIAPLTQLNELIFGDKPDRQLDLAEYCQATGLTAAQVDEMQQAGLIMPLDTGRYDQQDVAMGQVLARGAERGLTTQDIEFYPRLAREIVDHEMRLRAMVTSHLPDLEDATVTMQMVQSARVLRAYVIERVFQHRVAVSIELKDEGLLS